MEVEGCREKRARFKWRRGEKRELVEEGRRERGRKYRVLGEAVEEEEGGFREEWRRRFLKKVR